MALEEPSLGNDDFRVQHELEEEKEVPNEHPTNTHKITPSRNGCNVTVHKGFSFDNSSKCQPMGGE